MDEACDRAHMELALSEARDAASKGEVPIGAIVIHEGQVVGRGHNLREGNVDPTAHAEIIAIREASKALDRWRLSGTTLFVTLEPCLMCMGASILARVDRIVFGASDPKGGAAGSLYDVSNDGRLNHRIAIRGGVEAETSAQLLRLFFRQLREKRTLGARNRV